MAVTVSVQIRKIGRNGIEISAGDDWPSVTTYGGAQALPEALAMWFDLVGERFVEEVDHQEEFEIEEPTPLVAALRQIVVDGGSFAFVRETEG